MNHMITKEFGPYPFGHRQHNHKGHCAFVHGHNWYFEICLQSKDLDENGFVYDFGKFKDLKNWFEMMFDHTLLINADDPHLDFFKQNESIHGTKMWNLRIVQGGSAEKLAEMIFHYIEGYLVNHPSELIYVKVKEDHKNVAIYAR